MSEPTSAEINKLKKVACDSERQLSIVKRRLSELEDKNDELSRTLQERNSELKRLKNDTNSDVLMKAVRNLIMARNPISEVGEALVATSASVDLIAFTQQNGNGKPSLSIAVYDNSRGYVPFCSEHNSIGFRLINTTVDAIRDELRLVINCFRLRSDDMDELFRRQRPADEYDAEKHEKLTESLLTTRKCAALEVLKVPTDEALLKQIKLLTTHIQRDRGVREFDTGKDHVGCVNGVIVRDSETGFINVRAWTKTDYISRNTGIDVASLVEMETITLDSYNSTFTSRSIENFIQDSDAREFVTTLLMHRALGYHQKYAVLFLGPSDLGKSTHILLMISGFGGIACMAAQEAFKTDSNAALNAFTNSSNGRVLVYADDIANKLNETALKRTGNGVPIMTRRPGTGEPTRPQRPALVLMSANPDAIQKTLPLSIQPKIVVVPPSVLAPPLYDSGVDLVDDIISGVYASESLEYQIRCYNSCVKKTGVLHSILSPPDLLRDASSTLAEHCRLSTVDDDLKEEITKVVDPILKANRCEKYVRAEAVKNAILKNTELAKKIHITKSPGYNELKKLMTSVYNTKFVSSARMMNVADPVSSCFQNPCYGREP